MSKAIAGAAIIGAVFATDIIGAYLLGPAILNPAFQSLMQGLVLQGLSMEAGAIASALTSNRGMGITTRQPAAFRQVIYGEQRVGGVNVFESTTGSSHDQYNFVIVLAGHVCDSIVNLYLDGRQVFWQGSGAGYTVRNGVGFGGVADGADHTGPDGLLYNFGGTGHAGIYCEARYGDQLPGDVIGALTANDPNWAADGHGNSPWLGGCTYVYLKIEYNQTVFPNLPEIKFTVRGKNDIFDPRTGTRGYSTNWALQVADVLTDTTYGVGDVGAVNQDQLIVAANVCDEQVNVAATAGTEARYSCHFHTDTSTDPGNTLQRMMNAATGRLSRIGGEWFIWPAYFQGSSFTFDEGALVGEIEWTPYRSLKDLCNRVTGTYTAANWPYNTAGNLYDSNGFYNGMIANNFPFAFQPTSYPQYAQDPLHGFAADEYLASDSGVQGSWSNSVTYAAGDVIVRSGVIYKSLIDANLNLPPESHSAVSGPSTIYSGAATYADGDLVVYSGLTFLSLAGSNVGNQPDISPGDWASVVWIPYSNLLPREITQDCCLSVTQAQRCAKIFLERNRQQGSGTFPMALKALQMQSADCMDFTFAEMGWTGKLLEIVGMEFAFNSGERATDGSWETAPSVMFKGVKVAETAASIYEWDETLEELTVYDVPAIPTQQPRTPAPPTGMSLTSGAGTAVIGADNVVHPRVEVQWTTPADALSSQIQGEVQLAPAGVATGPWLGGFVVSSDLNLAYVSNVVAGQEYNFRIRSIRGNSGGVSAWVEEDGYTVAITLSQIVQQANGVGSLSAVAYTGGVASIFGVPFTTKVGNLSVVVSPGNYPLTGLNQNQTYEVYYIDPTFAGGAVTAIATQNPSDYQNKVGYFLIDSITTPIFGGGGGAGPAPWYPTAFADLQEGANQGTMDQAAPYSLDPTRYASLFGSYVSSVPETFFCEIIYSGWASEIPGTSTLTINLETYSFILNAGGTYTISKSEDGGATWTVITSLTGPTARGDLNNTITAGVDNADVQVKLRVDPVTGGSDTLLGLLVHDIHIH